MKNSFVRITSISLLLAIAFIFALILSSCNQAWYNTRDKKRLDDYAIQQPTEFLRLSNMINPCFDGKAKSDTIVRHDTTINKGDTVTSFFHDTLKQVIKLPGRIITTTITIHDTVPDNRGIAALQSQLNDCSETQIVDQTKLSETIITAQHRLWWIIALISIIVIAAGIKIYSFFSGGAIASIFKKVI